MRSDIDEVDETYRRADAARQLVRDQLCRVDGAWPKPAELVRMSNCLAWAQLRIQDTASDLDVVLGAAEVNRRDCLCRGMQEAHAAATAVPLTRHHDWWEVAAALYACVLLSRSLNVSRGCLALSCAEEEAWG